MAVLESMPPLANATARFIFSLTAIFCAFRAATVRERAVDNGENNARLLTRAALNIAVEILLPETNAVQRNARYPKSAPWHYVDVPITESRYDPKFCQSGGCVVSKIDDFKRVLENPKASKTEKQEALKFLIHFIADLHQPLHVGDTGSRGGNLIQVRFYNAGSNLHRVWDSQIMERHTTDERVWLWDLNGVTNPKLAAEWSKGTPEDWATESLQIAKEAYCLPGTKTVMKCGTKLDDDYYRMALPMIQKQLAKAGIRIAWTLNEIFK